MSTRLITNEFIEKSISKHGDKYDYALVDYKNAKTKVILTCKNNHKFEINTQKHLFGGCRKCFTDSRRLNLHGNPNIYNKDDMNKSCNKSFGELYRKTIKREEYLESIGYKVISIWEDDFNKKTDFV